MKEPTKRRMARFLAALLMTWWETCPRCKNGFGGHEKGVGRNVILPDARGNKHAYGLCCPTCAKGSA